MNSNMQLPQDSGQIAETIKLITPKEGEIPKTGNDQSGRLYLRIITVKDEGGEIKFITFTENKKLASSTKEIHKFLKNILQKAWSSEDVATIKALLKHQISKKEGKLKGVMGKLRGIFTSIKRDIKKLKKLEISFALEKAVLKKRPEVREKLHRLALEENYKDIQNKIQELEKKD